MSHENASHRRVDHAEDFLIVFFGRLEFPENGVSRAPGDLMSNARRRSHREFTSEGAKGFFDDDVVTSATPPLYDPLTEAPRGAGVLGGALEVTGTTVGGGGFGAFVIFPR